MYLGIDVGGTYTDGVLVSGMKVESYCKLPTDKQNLLQSLTKVLDEILRTRDTKQIARIVISTTLMTNLIAEKKYEPTGLLLMTGPGIGPKAFNFPFTTRILRGAIDFQGRIIEDIDLLEVENKVGNLLEEGIKNIGIVAKFSPRNPILENKVAEYIRTRFPQVKTQKGHLVSGNLNFPRRAMGTGLLLACQKQYTIFINAIKKAIKERGVVCPVYILKADGGIIPIDIAHRFIVDTILSGPAASAFGAKAILKGDTSAFVADIGGTTTDLSIILDSNPLVASKGVKIQDLFTHVRSLAVSSIPVGGDTGIEVKEGKLCLTFQRHGYPLALGGTTPTLTDCLRVQGLTDIGDQEKAGKGLQRIATALNKSIQEIAQLGIDLAVTEIKNGLDHMLKSWQEEPAYKIWQLLHPRSLVPSILITLGGPSSSLGPILSKKIGLAHVNNSLCKVANAIGAALALPTYQETVRINTETGELTASWGYHSQHQLPNKLPKEEGANIAQSLFIKHLETLDVKDKPLVYEHEVFNMVRNWYTTGQIHEIKLEIPPRILGQINSGEGV